ncbi:unnamed protein product [Discosporangium mesarthrocarpum]
MPTSAGLMDGRTSVAEVSTRQRGISFVGNRKKKKKKRSQGRVMMADVCGDVQTEQRTRLSPLPVQNRQLPARFFFPPFLIFLLSPLLLYHCHCHCPPYRRDRLCVCGHAC